ncbi:MAG: glycine reductase, partial [Clostridiales bacterium]|nr:glycine reductase [Clostridiales bacterium]
DIVEIAKKEFAALNKAGFKEVLTKITQAADSKKEKTEEVKAPPKKVVTFAIAGIDILELENAVQELWKNNIYSESGMGCTGPIVLVNDEDADKAKEVLVKKEYLG